MKIMLHSCQQNSHTLTRTYAALEAGFCQTKDQPESIITVWVCQHINVYATHINLLQHGKWISTSSSNSSSKRGYAKQNEWNGKRGSAEQQQKRRQFEGHHHHSGPTGCLRVCIWFWRATVANEIRDSIFLGIVPPIVERFHDHDPMVSSARFETMLELCPVSTNEIELNIWYVLENMNK